jgi:hypothetical protein
MNRYDLAKRNNALLIMMETHLAKSTTTEGRRL